MFRVYNGCEQSQWENCNWGNTAIPGMSLKNDNSLNLVECYILEHLTPLKSESECSVPFPNFDT